MSAPVFQIEFTQDIKKPVLVQHCGNVVFTGDNRSDTISVSVLEDGEPYAISGTVAMNCIRADGATVTVTGSISGNTASATLTQACVAIPGPLAVVIKVTSDSTTTTLLKAVYMVDVGVTGTAVDPGTIIPDVTTLINAIETAVGSIPADYSDLLATIAPNFVSGTYNKDQYVWNNGTLYRFTDNHSGSWTGTDVEAVVIADELAGLKCALSLEDMKASANKTVGLFNLIDRESLYNKKGYFLNSSGALTYGQNYIVSHYIKVKPSTSYSGANITAQTNVYLAEYDADFNIVNTAIGNLVNNAVYTTGATTQYMRLTIEANGISNAVFAESNEILSLYDLAKCIKNNGLSNQWFLNSNLAANAYYTGIRTSGLPFGLVETYDHTSVSSNKAVDSTTTGYSLSQIIGIPDSVTKISVLAEKEINARASVVFLSDNNLTVANIVSVEGFTTRTEEYLATYTVPNGAKYFMVGMKRNSTKNTVIAVYASEYDPTAIETKINTIAEEKAEAAVAPYDSRLDTLEAFKSDAATYVVDKPKNRLDYTAVTANKILWKNGNIQDNTSYAYTDYIAVEPGDTISIYYKESVTGWGKSAARTFAAYSADKTLLSSEGSDSPSTDITVGEHTYFVRITATKGLISDADDMIFVNDTTIPTVFYPYYNTTARYVAKPEFVNDAMNPVICKNQYGITAKAATMANGETLTACSDIDNKKNDIITFYAEIDSLSAVKVGHGYNMAYGSYLVVDDTNLTTYFGASQYFQHAHGLTFSHYISIEIKHNHSGRADIAIRTDGGEYTVAAASIAWDGCKGSVFATSDGSSLLNACLSCTFNDFQENVFIFGDSYVGISDNARWPTHLIHDGYVKNAIFGYGGATSSAQKTVLDNVLAIAKPNYIVWALGMNDADTSSAINGTYKTILDSVIAKCEKLNIVPILATIPNTPTANHTFKNAYVKSLGYRYIDFAAAVGATEAESEWWSGMLSSDNTHPTALGAKALYARFVADVPEALKL